MSRDTEVAGNDFNPQFESTHQKVETQAAQSFTDEVYGGGADRDRPSKAERLHEKHERVREDAAPLFEGSPPLMQVLDAQGKGHVDGRVSERDMRRFLIQCDVNEQAGNGGQWPYTKENAQYVSDLLDGKYPHITGSNFTGFSAEALCRRAGLEHLIVRRPEDYDLLVSNFRSAMDKGTPVDEAPMPPAKETKEDSAGDRERDRKEQDAEHHEKRDKIAVPCGVAPEKIDDLCTLHKGEGYWHVAERLLNAGFPPGNRATNTEINAVMRALVAENLSKIDTHGKPVPMVHPGQVVGHEHLDAIAKRVPRLAQSLRNLDGGNE